VESGRIAGLLNGFCYLGSTISSYGLGVIADNHGWDSVFYLLFAVCVFVCLVAAVYTFVLKRQEKRKATQENEA
jgi:sugar phosphate permease